MTKWVNINQILYYLLIFVLGVGVLQALGIGFLFFFKRSGEKRANAFYGWLLITFGLTLLHNVFLISGWLERFPILSYLPFYYSLAFPTLLFYYVKLNLYPKYHFIWSDVKHFILPVGQFLFFVLVLTTATNYASPLKRNFYNPFFGAFEQLLYLITFFLYMYFSRRYIVQKRKEVNNRAELRKILYLRILIRVLFILFCVHTVFVVADFICYEFFDINLRTVKPYAALGALSFAALLFWLGIYGFQVLFWGRQVFGRFKGKG
ncbi:MAG: hypothetical protein SFU99_07600 [Saprospiraceae bacterium]|nr:hypothetical protein [Saprospiraceae bacterium]